VLYEVLPISYLVVKAGGLASTGTDAMSNLVVKGFTQKADIVIGSGEEV
jgi:fructose-1,6-bisphosphatase